jgi:hypothetical protein
MSGHIFWDKIVPCHGGMELDGVIFYTEGSLCEGKVGAEVFSGTSDIWESYALGTWLTCNGLPNRGICNSLLF